MKKGGRKMFNDKDGLAQEDEDAAVPSRTGEIAETGAPDVSEYLRDLEGLDMDEAAKIELLTILHDILCHFVEIGFDLRGADVCGQLFGDFAGAAAGDADGVESGAFTAPETPADQTEEEDSP
jgi:hypothetical protein